MKTTILLVDDHPVLRKGLRILLEDEPDFTVVGEADNGEQGINQARELSPDVVIMDITMPGIDGIEATRRIMRDTPQSTVIALSIHGGKRFVESMLEAGAAGYLLKDSVPEELVKAVRAVGRGENYLSAEVTGLVISQYVDLLSRVQSTGGPAKLTKPEQRLILLIAEGCSDSQLAESLACDAEVIDTLHSSVLQKLGLSNRSQLMEYAGAQKWFSGQEGVEQAMHHASKEGHFAPAAQPLLEPLTARETDTLKLLGQRLYNKEIADQLCVSVETVKTHLKNIFQKLNVTNRREAIAKAEQLGLIDD